MLPRPMIIVVCGIPAHGKTTIANLLAERLGVRHLDVDESRVMLFGVPPPTSDTLSGAHAEEIGGAYQVLVSAAETFLSMGRSVIISASFIREVRQKLLYDLYDRHKEAMKIIWCDLRQHTDAEVLKRLRARPNDYSGGVNTLEEYRRVRAACQPLRCSHFILDTSPPRTPAECVEGVLPYIQS